MLPDSSTTEETIGLGRSSACRWIVFDAVGTLIEPEPSVAEAYHAVGSRLGSRLDVTEIGIRFRSAFRRSEQDGFPGGPTISKRWMTSDLVEEARWRWIVTEVFHDISDQESCFRELWDHFARPSSWRCFSDVETSLAQFSKAGYRLAIASNFDHRLHSVCDAMPHLSPVEHRIVSSTVGFRKPAPEFYSAIIRACECQPHQILMIGDNKEYDVLAPRAAGLRALHLERTCGDQNGLRSLMELSNAFIES